MYSDVLHQLVKRLRVGKETFWGSSSKQWSSLSPKFTKTPNILLSHSNSTVFCSIAPLILYFLFHFLTMIYCICTLLSYHFQFHSYCTLFHKATTKAWIKTSGWIDWFIHMSPLYSFSTPSIYFVLVKCTFMLAFANCSFYLTERLIAGTCSSGHGAHQKQNESQQRSIDYSGISSSAARLPL